MTHICEHSAVRAPQKERSTAPRRRGLLGGLHSQGHFKAWFLKREKDTYSGRVWEGERQEKEAFKSEETVFPALLIEESIFSPLYFLFCYLCHRLVDHGCVGLSPDFPEGQEGRP